MHAAWAVLKQTDFINFSGWVVFGTFVSFLLPLWSLSFATEALAGDRESHSLLWLLTRPLSRPAICSSVCAGAAGCSSIDPSHAVCCGRHPAPSHSDLTGHPSGRVVEDPGASAPRVGSALNSWFHFLLLVGDSRFFPTLAAFVHPRTVREERTKLVLKRRWKRSQVVLELPFYCIYRS